MSLAALLDEIRNDLLTMPGITRVYEDVPEGINEFPAVIVAGMGGRCWMATHDGSLMCEHDIRVEVHIPRKDLPNDAATMTALADDAALFLYRGFVTDRYNGTMVTTGDPRTGGSGMAAIDYTVGPSQWAAQQTYAMMCDFKVTTQREVTV